MNLHEFPSVQNENKTNLNKKIKQSELLQKQIEKFKSNGGVVKVIAAFGLAPKHCSYKEVNDSYHKTA